MTENGDNERIVEIGRNGTVQRFNIDDPELPDWVDEGVMTSGDYPYEKKLKRGEYEETLERLQIELVELKTHMEETGERVMILFEGRDSAGKGGSIKTLTSFLNPRSTRVVALPKPTETERGQWYFQRYVDHFPTSGEMVMFDRSWYNRGGVEPVMGFCTPAQHENFLDETPGFEKMVVNEGIRLFKFWLNIGQETQLKRFHDRRHSKLKHWKLSGIDIKGMNLWDDYTRARNTMIDATHSAHAPWTVVRFNDKRRGRIEVIRNILQNLDYRGKDAAAIGKPDRAIIGHGPDMLD